MEKWQAPELTNLSLSKTTTVSDYVTVCNWDGASGIGVGNEEYTDPNNKPAEHPDWVWCYKHKRWHPQDHSNGGNGGNEGNGGNGGNGDSGFDS